MQDDDLENNPLYQQQLQNINNEVSNLETYRSNSFFSSNNQGGGSQGSGSSFWDSLLSVGADVFNLAKPLIAAQISKPNKIQNAGYIRDDVRNDPRVQALYGPYGLGATAAEDRFPTIKAPTSLQLSAGYLINNTQRVIGDYFKDGNEKRSDQLSNSLATNLQNNNIAKDGSVSKNNPMYLDIKDMNFKTPDNLLESIAFAESGNKTGLTSSSGALGYMQLLPSTAREVAMKMGMEYDEDKLKNDKYYNKKLGQAYFEERLKARGGDVEQALIDYNMGYGDHDRIKKGIASRKEKDGSEVNISERYRQAKAYSDKVLLEYLNRTKLASNVIEENKNG